MRNMKMSLENDCGLRLRSYAEIYMTSLQISRPNLGDDHALDHANRLNPIGCNRNAPVLVHSGWTFRDFSSDADNAAGCGRGKFSVAQLRASWRMQAEGR